MAHGKRLLLAASALGTACLAYWLWTPDLSRAALQARYLADPADMIQLGDWHLHVRDSGPRDAPAIVLVHGFASSLQTWDAWAGSLQRRYRVVRLDLPGSGLSWPDPANDYTDARSMELLGALMQRLGLAKATIVGHSIGGRIAWTFAATYPGKVDKLVLVAPDGFAGPGDAYGQGPPRVPRVLGLMRHVLPKPLLRMNLRAAYADPGFVTDELLDRYHDLIRAPGGRQSLLERFGQRVLVDPVPRLAEIQAPTLLLWGEQDALIPVASADRYLQVMPHATLERLAACGHLPQEEAAARSVAVVEAFLAR